MASSTTPTPATTTVNPILQHTTLRGMATASFCFGFWGTLVFWWYPYGPMLAAVGVLFGLITMAMGVRAGLRRENLALGGVILGMNAIGLGFASYRGVQAFFEGASPFMAP
jgi:hypothetical protein